MTPTVVNVSPSLLADIIKCETYGWVRHVRGYTSVGESIKATAGSAFHAALAEFFNPEFPEPLPGPDSPTAAALRRFHAIYDPAFAAVPADKLPDAAYTPANLHRVLARWLEMHPPSALPWRRVLSVEEAFVSREWLVSAGGEVLPTQSGPPRGSEALIRLIVRPDLIVEDMNGGVRWVDTKTTGWRIADAGWRRQLRLSLQAALYTDAVVQKYGDRAVLGGWFSAIEMRTLPSDPTRKCATHKVAYAECGNEHAKYEFIEAPQTEERLTRALCDARDAAARFVALMHEGDADSFVSNLRMEGTANGSCRFCPAGEWCEAQRVPGALGSFMHYEPWIVSEGERA